MNARRATPKRSTASIDVASPKEFENIFSRVYQRFYNSNKISAEDEKLICAQEVEVDEFDRLTDCKQYARYISLMDGRISFHEVPNAPHGQVIDCLVFSVNSQIERNMLIGTVDNDMRLTNRSKKRPDYSWQLRKPSLSTPPPAWMKFLPDGLPYPNIVVEVAVNNESPEALLGYADNYFSILSSVWIGVKIFAVGKKFWVGWGERAPAGIGCTVHTTMAWPPQHWDIATPIDTIYKIPMILVYGPGIPCYFNRYQSSNNYLSVALQPPDEFEDNFENICRVLRLLTFVTDAAGYSHTKLIVNIAVVTYSVIVIPTSRNLLEITLEAGIADKVMSECSHLFPNVRYIDFQRYYWDIWFNQDSGDVGPFCSPVVFWRNNWIFEYRRSL